MKVALILPPITLEERYNKAFVHVTGSLPPLGLLSIGTVLKSAGHNVVVLDGSISSHKNIIKEIERFNPEIVGITAMTCMWPKVKSLSKELKGRWSKIKIIVGGVHPTIIKEKALLEIPYIDAVSWGEGEFPMLEYVENLRDPGSVLLIPGIASRDKAGNIVIGPNRKPIENLDTLPIPNRSLVPVKRYVPSLEQYKKLPVTNIVTTRGCLFKCLFCLQDLLGEEIRYRSIDKVIEEIEYLINEFGIRDVAFWDDIFTLDGKRVFSICERIIEKKINFVWSAQARADCITPEMIEIMARAGCWKLYYGVESLVQKNLDFLKKGETVEQIFEAIKITKKFRIEVETSFIFGIPGETFQEGIETIRGAIKLDPDYAKFFSLCPYGNFYGEAEKYGTFVTRDMTKFTGNTITFVPFSMTADELQNLLYIAFRKFYLRPKSIWRRLKKIFNPLEFRKSLSGLLALVNLIIAEFKHRWLR